MEFKDRICILRNMSSLSPSQLGAAMNKSEGAVRSWESGKAKPDCDTLIKLAEYFDCTTDYLLGLSNAKNIARVDTFEGEMQVLHDLIGKMPVFDFIDSFSNNLVNLLTRIRRSDNQTFDINSFNVLNSYLKELKLFLDKRNELLSFEFQSSNESHNSDYIQSMNRVYVTIAELFLIKETLDKSNASYMSQTLNSLIDTFDNNDGRINYAFSRGIKDFIERLNNSL